MKVIGKRDKSYAIKHKSKKYLAMFAVFAMIFAVFAVIYYTEGSEAAPGSYESPYTWTSENSVSLDGGANYNKSLADVFDDPAGDYQTDKKPTVTLKAGYYNVTVERISAGNHYLGSGLTLVHPVTIRGATNASGAPATVIFADFANNANGANNLGFTANELIYAKGSEISLNNLELMPMVYYDYKYASDSGDGEKYRLLPMDSSGSKWFTPNCTITVFSDDYDPLGESSTFSMDNIVVSKIDTGLAHLPAKNIDGSAWDANNNAAYMMEDGGNCQFFGGDVHNRFSSYYGSYMDYAITISNFKSCGGLSFSKVYATEGGQPSSVTLTNIDIDVPASNSEDRVKDGGDARGIKIRSVSDIEFTNDNVVINILGRNSINTNDDLNRNVPNSVVNIKENLEITADFTINSDVELNIAEGKTLTIQAEKTVTNNGTINVNGALVKNGTITGTGHTYVPVTFNKNSESASGTMPVQKVEFNVATPLTANAFTITGYKLLGWAESADGAVAYADGANVTLTAGKILYAKWAPISYNIAFDANLGTGTTAAVDATYDENATLTAVGFTRADYAFGGWATSASGAAVYSDKAVVKNLSSTDGATVTLYAVWIQIEKTENAAVVTVTTDAVSDQAADQLVNAAKQMKDAGTENVSVDVKATETESVSIKSDSIKEAVDSGIGVNIATSKGAMEFSSEALAGLLEDGKTLKSEIKEIEVPPAYAEKIPADAKVFSISLTSNDTAITSFNGKFTVKVAYTATGSTDNLYVGYLAADGTIQKMESHYEDGFMVFTTDHLSDYAILEESSSANNQGLLLAVLLVAAIVLPIIAALIIFRKK